MTKVFILEETYKDDSGLDQIYNVVGAVSKEDVATKYTSKEDRSYEEFELDDPELLNRIAKEGK